MNKMSIISSWIKTCSAQLANQGIASARLDAELILAHCLEVNRPWLLAHGDTLLQGPTLQQANALLERRSMREPIAYLLGYKEFYGRKFIVTPDVLIPRPETEVLVEELVRLFYGREANIHDVGVGSGCITVTAALELPAASISGSDVSPEAIKVARQNAEALGAKNVSFRTDHLMNSSHGPYDAITANLPYVDPEWETSPELIHEPSTALFADNNGLKLIFELLEQSPSRLRANGYLLLEADPKQHAAIISHAKETGLHLVTVRDYIVVLQK